MKYIHDKNDYAFRSRREVTSVTTAVTEPAILRERAVLQVERRLRRHSDEWV